MRSAIRISIFALVFTAVLVFAQAPPAKPDPNEVQVKDTPASQSLVQLAKDQEADQKHLNDIFQQARSSLDSNNKALQDELTKSQKALDDKLKADKKYRDDLAHIADIQSQITNAGTKAQQAFQQSIGPIQQKLNMASAQVQGLIPVVRKENGLPDTATFDMATQKWTNPPKK